jgi:hypothetical protein
MSERNKWYWVLQDISAKNAGLEVRTKPIIDELQKIFCSVIVVSTNSILKTLMERKIIDDAVGFIFAKPIDSQTSLLMTELKERGYPIVIDLFDNYASFSTWSYQTGIPYQWRQSLHLADTVIVSSPVIESRIRDLKPSTTLIHVCDPLPWYKYEDYSLSIPKNSLKKWNPPYLKRKLLWFGISSNPYYQLGLADLIKWLPLIKKLYAIRPLEMEIELVICGNLVTNMLNVVLQYQQAGITTRFVAWSKETCAIELETAHCVLLPTGKGEFSCSKTHNRLSEAIINRCIVFTTSAGPYENFIGGAVQTTLSGIQQLLFYADDLTINAELQKTASTLEKNLPFTQQVGVLNNQLKQLKKHLRRLDSSCVSALFKFVLMSFQSPGIIAKTARKIDYLIVGYAYNQTPITYDIYLQSVNLKSQVVFITCTDLGKKTLESLRLQLTAHDDENLFSLPLPTECIEKCEQLALYSQLDSSHKSIYTQTNALSIAILITLLKSEKSEFFLADDTGICWPTYIEMYADYLIKPIQKLESVWKKSYEIQ